MFQKDLKMIYSFRLQKINSNRRITIIGICLMITLLILILDNRKDISLIYLPPGLESISKEPNIKWSNSSNVVEHLREINKDYGKQLDKLLKTSCNPKKLTNADCLNDLNRLEKEISDKKSSLKQYHPSLECANKSKLLFHSFWSISSGLYSRRASEFSMRVLKLNVMSFLATQNLHCSKLILWSLDSFPDKYREEIYTMFEKYFTSDAIGIQIFNVEALCRLSLWSQNGEFKKSGICTKNTSPWFAFNSKVAFSDLGIVIDLC